MSRRTTIAATLLIAVALAAGCTMFEDEYTPEPLPLPPETDVAYGPVTGCAASPALDDKCGGSQELDIYRSEKDGPNPVVLWIHGGGFVGGDKGAGVNEYFQPLLDDGWDILAINYRLSMADGTNRFPAAVQDVNRAVRWVKANAKEQDWDPERVAAIGHSAGGNLAGMLATAADVTELQPVDLPAPLQDADPSIIAAVGLEPVSDLRLYSQSMFGDTVLKYLGCIDCPELLAAGSVQTHVDADSSPYMAIHGADDSIASPEQGELVGDAYDKIGLSDRFRMIVVDDGPMKFRGHEPDVKRFVGDMLDFINTAADQVGSAGGRST